jgi:hypothetical protein
MKLANSRNVNPQGALLTSQKKTMKKSLDRNDKELIAKLEQENNKLNAGIKQLDLERNDNRCTIEALSFKNYEIGQQYNKLIDAIKEEKTKLEMQRMEMTGDYNNYNMPVYTESNFNKALQQTIQSILGKVDKK